MFDTHCIDCERVDQMQIHPQPLDCREKLGLISTTGSDRQRLVPIVSFKHKEGRSRVLPSWMSRGFSDQEYADWPRISILNTRRRIMAYLGVISHIG